MRTASKFLFCYDHLAIQSDDESDIPITPAWRGADLGKRGIKVRLNRVRKRLAIALVLAGASMRRLGVSTDFWFFFVRRFLFFAFGEAALLYGGFISDFYPHSGGVA
jgi:hypothetical protein